MRLYVETMDAVVVDVDAEGRVRYEGAEGTAPGVGDGWAAPTLQERRAIIHAARQEMDALAELLDIFDPEDRRTD
jgi:hypothetical protein